MYRTVQIVELANVYSKWLLIPKKIPRGFEFVFCSLPCMLIFCCVVWFFFVGRGILNIDANNVLT